MKSKNKLISILLLVTVLVLVISTTVIAAQYTPDEFEQEITTTGAGTDDIKETGGKIVGIIRVIGTIVSVGMIVVLGIKYMMGSAEERAEYKKTLFPYIVGAVLIFAASSLVDVIYSWASEL